MYERMDRLIKEINSEGVLRASQALPTPSKYFSLASS